MNTDPQGKPYYLVEIESEQGITIANSGHHFRTREDAERWAEHESAQSHDREVRVVEQRYYS